MASELILVKSAAGAALSRKKPCHPHERHPHRVRVPYRVTFMRMQFVTHWGTPVIAPTRTACVYRMNVL
jgi:hypothetical protein